jgi:hypothetical protein
MDTLPNQPWKTEFYYWARSSKDAGQLSSVSALEIVSSLKGRNPRGETSVDTAVNNHRSHLPLHPHLHFQDLVSVYKEAQ